MKTKNVDDRIGQDLRLLQAHVLAVWEILAAMHPGKSYALMTVVLSDVAFWAARVGCNQLKDIFPQKKLVSGELELTVDGGYAMHFIPAADMQRAPRDKAQPLWSERNARIIIGKEKNDIVLIPTSESIAQLFTEGNDVRPFPEMESKSAGRVQVVRFPSGTEACLWQPHQQRVESFLRTMSPDEHAGVYDEMMDTLFVSGLG